MGCHLTGFEKSCRSLVTRSKNCCKRWMQIQGKDPNTGQPVNRWDCVDNWGPLLQIENSQQQRQTAAAIESFRNETVMQNAAVMRAAMLTERLMLGTSEDVKLLGNGKEND